jgi:hypothetical protein
VAGAKAADPISLTIEPMKPVEVLQMVLANRTANKKEATTQNFAATAFDSLTIAKKMAINSTFATLSFAKADISAVSAAHVFRVCRQCQNSVA